ncbi:Ig-like domain-containing protein [Anaerovorax odorimutans]|uniref:Ig-like domain-containing protein n=1 Tax=Anaerovorax odorimutans TaxID=109327 RepID=UPI000413C36E|nr:Ig-like domain-containing protein [Anaerovorax odorimutans]
MKKDKRKLLSFILCLALIFGMTGAFGLFFEGNLPVANAEDTQDLGTGSGDLTGSGSEEVAATTFSAILINPGESSLSSINLNNAEFQIEFNTEVKKNAIRVDEAVSVLSGDAIIATANETGDVKGITYSEPDVNDKGTKTKVTFTVDPTLLNPNTTYKFKLDANMKNDIKAVPPLTLGEDVIYQFTTSEDEYVEPEVTPEVTFAAINLYPIKDAKNILVDDSFNIGFSKSIKENKNITNNTAVELKKIEGTTVPAILTLSDGNKILTVDPAESLEYGTKYELVILDNTITCSESGIKLTSSSITFKTTSFDNITVEAQKQETSGASISLNLHNAGAEAQNAKIVCVVRRDRGANLEEGGTVVAKCESELSVEANNNKEIQINIEDITKNLVNGDLVNLEKGNIFADVYIMNKNGEILYTPLHKEII